MTAKKTSKSDSAKSEIRITVSDQAREISIETSVERDEVRSLVEAALKSSTPLVLTDTRGRQFIIPASKISSVEIGDISERRVGFAGI
jgi:hypothetical protein